VSCTANLSTVGRDRALEDGELHSEGSDPPTLGAAKDSTHYSVKVEDTKF
jgi:hypothetical protein